MNLDVPHVIATGVIIFAVLWGLDRTPVVEEMPKGRKTLITFVVLFAALFLMNILWPSGQGV